MDLTKPCVLSSYVIIHHLINDIKILISVSPIYLGPGIDLCILFLLVNYKQRFSNLTGCGFKSDIVTLNIPN